MTEVKSGTTSRTVGTSGRAATRSLPEDPYGQDAGIIGKIIDIFKNARQPMFLVCVSDQARRLGYVNRKPVRMESGSAGRRVRLG